MQKELTFYLIRHGRTIWNDQGLMQGSGNSNLTEEGVKGAQLTGKALADVPFVALIQAVYNAPLTPPTIS